MALAQETDLLLLDEPTTYLDLSHQLEVLDLLTDLNRRRGTTVVIVMHDLNLACRYADHLIAMRDGRISAEGTPNEVVTAEAMLEVFGLRSRIILDPVSQTPTIIPIGRHHCADGSNGFGEDETAVLSGEWSGETPVRQHDVARTVRQHDGRRSLR
jgi:iron complex transport system ATP-binding protein